MEDSKRKRNRSDIVLMVLAGMTSLAFLISGIYTYMRYKEYGGSLVLCLAGFISLVFLLDAIRFFCRRLDLNTSRANASGCKAPKSLGQGIFGICFGAVVFGAITFMLSQAVAYNAKVPKIFAEEQITCVTNEELCFEDLASYRVMDGIAVETWMEFYAKPDDVDAWISEDQQVIHTGSKPGTLSLSVYARGVEQRSKTITLVITE